MERGLVFDVQRFSPHDGPGIRTTVFLKGCPLRCAWCHNPESMLAAPEVMTRPGRCIECGACLEVCSTGAAIPTTQGHPAAGDCTLCGDCAEACPAGAREIVGQERSVDDLVEELLRDRLFFEESGGGVTFSGGEPLAQSTFLAGCLEALRRHEIHTAVDTSGQAPLIELLRVAPLTGLFLFDVKVVDEERHRRFTGASNELILSNLRSLAAVHQRIWLRVPVIPGFNDDEENIDATARVAASLPSVRRVCLLPFHRTGSGKLRQIGKDGGIGAVAPPSPERMKMIAGRFESAGLATFIGG